MTSRTTTLMVMAWIGLAGCGGTTAFDPGSGGAGAGSSQGGSAQGGNAQGGNGTGAQGGDGGNAQGGGGLGGSGGSGGSGVAECTTAAECQLEDSCCNCQGLPSTEPLPACIENCFAPMCAGHAPKPVEAACRAGQCVTNIDCDHKKVLCLAIQPECPPGQTASVDGGCWGPCLPSTECAQVGSCAQCGDDQACVAEVAQLGPVYHCVDLPGTCEGKADCDCLGESVCVGGFDLCLDGADGVVECHCPAC